MTVKMANAGEPDSEAAQLPAPPCLSITPLLQRQTWLLEGRSCFQPRSANPGAWGQGLRQPPPNPHPRLFILNCLLHNHLSHQDHRVFVILVSPVSKQTLNSPKTRPARGEIVTPLAPQNWAVGAGSQTCVPVHCFFRTLP